MGFFQKVKALFQLKSFFIKIKEIIQMSNHNYFSTEFIGKIIVQILLVLGAVRMYIPAEAAAIIVASLTAIYMVCRTIYKIKNPGQDLPDLPTVNIDNAEKVQVGK